MSNNEMSGFVFNEFERKLEIALEVRFPSYSHVPAFLKPNSTLLKRFPGWTRTRGWYLY